MSALADDVVLHSPLTGRFTFDGKDASAPVRGRYERFEASRTTR